MTPADTSKCWPPTKVSIGFKGTTGTNKLHHCELHGKESSGSGLTIWNTDLIFAVTGPEFPQSKLLVSLESCCTDLAWKQGIALITSILHKVTECTPLNCTACRTNLIFPIEAEWTEDVLLDLGTVLSLVASLGVLSPVKFASE